tara:strand:- start:293 stop:2368 length:2076 start_codon:yes stop_codon:yes gene_type:complete
MSLSAFCKKPALMALEKDLAIRTIEDLVTCFPFRYERKAYVENWSLLHQYIGQTVVLSGKIVDAKLEGHPRRQRLQVRLSQSGVSLNVVYFKHAQWMLKKYPPGHNISLTGKLQAHKGKLNIAHPEIMARGDLSQELGLIPVYPSSEKLKRAGLDSGGMAKLIQKVLSESSSKHFENRLPAYLMKHFGPKSRLEALRTIHRPESFEEGHLALQYFKFEEIFWFKLQQEIAKRQVGKKPSDVLFSSIGQHFNTFYQKILPFSLTEAQKRVIKTIREDTASGRQMNRLLQGDVGSGKTIVAFFSALLALDNGYQVCLMAPTEILSQQHFEGLQPFCRKLGLRCALLTGSTPAGERKTLLHGTKSGQIDLLIGTHALLEDRVQFASLGLAIIDEQHRFGVAQRARLWAKSESPPHILVMTATPIPRTLAMTLYGDLDVSVIDELPPGRQPIVTSWEKDNSRLKVFGFIKEQVDKGHQVYVVYPLIEESQKLDLKDLQDGYESLERYFPKPKYQLGIVHGRMHPKDKDFEMKRFASNESHILVATTVIEVGVNVPNATVMVIENAERFGLSQLHQLRGRIGRGSAKSYCVLLTSNKISEVAQRRMQIMTASQDGFRIAQEDLLIRGPGDIAGTKQSGLLDFKAIDLANDTQIVHSAALWVRAILDKDNMLEKEDNLLLRRRLRELKPKWAWSEIS